MTATALEDDTQVLIIADEERKRLWLWKGQNCPVRLKFIGSRSVTELRKREYSFAYQLRTIDQGEETIEFLEFASKLTGKTFELPKARPQVEPSTAEMPAARTADAEPAGTSVGVRHEFGSDLPSRYAKMGGTGARPHRTILSAIAEGEMEDATGVAGQKVGAVPAEMPRKQAAAPAAAAVPAHVPAHVEAESQEALLKKSWKTINELGTPRGTQRYLVVVGRHLYTETLDGLEPLEEPPEGVFFVGNLVPRMICENGKILALEFLEVEEGVELDIDEKMSMDITSLLEMFQIEMA